MQDREAESKLCQRNSIKSEDSEVWPNPAHPNEPICSSRGIRQSTRFARLIVAFAGLLLLSSQLAYAIFPWPVTSTTAETAAYIVWRSDVAGTSQVNYGLTSSYGSSTTKDSTLVIYHAQLITGLTVGTTYHYQVVSVDGSNNSVSSQDYTFTTLPAPTGTVLTVGGGKTYSTISACITAASAGNTCEVYASGKSPSGGGALSPSGYDENVSVSKGVTVEAHDPVVVAQWTLGSSVSNATIEGFEVSTTAFTDFQNCTLSVPQAFTTNTNSNLTIQSNYIHNMYNGEILRESTLGFKTNTIRFLNNIAAFTVITNTNPPYTHPCSSVDGGFGVGGIDEYGDYGLYDANYFTEIDHVSYGSGAYNIYRRNVHSHSFAADWGADPNNDHVDFFHPSSNTSSYGGAHMRHNVQENNQEYDNDAPDEHFYQASACADQSAKQIATGDGSTKTFSGNFSLTNPNGTDTGIAVFSVLIAVNASNLGCSGSQYGSVTGAGVDDGFGHIVSGFGTSFVSSGTINYTTGAYSVTFTTAPGNGVPITAYWSLLNLSSHDMITRFNIGDAVGGGFAGPSYGGTPGMRSYNNTIYHGGYSGTGSNTGSGCNSYAGLSDANQAWTDKNNLWYNGCDPANGPFGSRFNALSPPLVQPGYDLAYDTSCAPSCSYPSVDKSAPGMVLNQNPLINNVSANDFSLQSGSPALHAGGYLTTVASTDSGSGTSLIVTDAGLFQDGYTISGVNADCISVTTVSNHVCITAVNYQTNTLTLATGITRSAGDPVWLYSDSTGRTVLTGNAPNIGATFAQGSGPAPPTNLKATP